MESGLLANKFYSIDEPYAGGLFECPDRSLFFRHARAGRRFWETAALPLYDGGPLYPCGLKYPGYSAVVLNYGYTCAVNEERLKQKWDGAMEYMEDFKPLFTDIGPTHTVGGNGYTHSIPGYERIVREGLNGYGERAGGLPPGDFRDGLYEIIEGIRAYLRRSLALITDAGGQERLVEALSRVPFKPARNFYEALVCWNFIYYVDGCDNPGRLDAGLISFYDGEEDAEDLLRALFRNVDDNDGWSGALGPDYNALTLCCLRAVRGIRRPNLELRVVPDMPAEIWSAAAEALATGCGQPAFYNEPLYQKALAERFPDIPKKDLLRFNGGGCTETMLAGLSNVGSLDAGVNVAAVFEPFLGNQLCGYNNFESFCTALLNEIKPVVRDVLLKINAYQEKRAALRPNPVRTLLIDDCIEKGLDYNAGGARYYWSVVNIAGLINVVDSLLAVKHLVFDTGLYTAGAFIDALRAEDPALYAAIRLAPCYGADDAAADRFAAGFVRRVYEMFEQETPWLGGQFLPSSIQFTTYVGAGERVGPTPDGRGAGDPLADSIGPVRQTGAGLTAVLNSAAKLPLYKALGTPVLNLRVQKSALAKSLKPLVLGYFEQGGMQLQISCISREDMEDAFIHPERHNDLIVRIGGYSEYFNRLDDELKKTVLEREEFA